MGSYNSGAVITRFAERRVNRRTGKVSWKGSNVYCRNTYMGTNVLYSYGEHFPLAVFLGVDTDGRNVFLRNGDKYSSTTAKHQHETSMACYGPSVSFTSLIAAHVRPEPLQLDDILDWTPDMNQSVYVRKDGSMWTREYGSREFKAFPRPRAGMLMGGDTEYSDTFQVWNSERGEPEQYDCPPYRAAVWHCVGSALIRNRDDVPVLCAVDEGQYFAAGIPANVHSIAAAYNALKPRAVREAERKGLNVLRQGEWFFLPLGMDDAALASELGMTMTALHKASPKTGLPHSQQQQDTWGVVNDHKVKHLRLRNGKRILARGCCDHPQHHRVTLGNEWHRAVRNREIFSFSLNGDID